MLDAIPKGRVCPVARADPSFAFPSTSGLSLFYIKLCIFLIPSDISPDFLFEEEIFPSLKAKISYIPPPQKEE